MVPRGAGVHEVDGSTKVPMRAGVHEVDGSTKVPSGAGVHEVDRSTMVPRRSGEPNWRSTRARRSTETTEMARGLEAGGRHEVGA